jgi:hypothetical protein
MCSPGRNDDRGQKIERGEGTQESLGHAGIAEWAHARGDRQILSVDQPGVHLQLDEGTASQIGEDQEEADERMLDREALKVGIVCACVGFGLALFVKVVWFIWSLGLTGSTAFMFH